LEFEKIVPAASLFVHGWYDRFDQLRGISPIASALGTLQDTYEGFDMALAKLKVHQLFALAFYRDADTGFDTTTATTDADDDGILESGYEVDFGKGPVQLDLNPGDKAEFLESKTPATETVQFLQMMIHVALKSLDLPYSFYDESHTNFFGSKGALQNYLKSCHAKRADLRELLDEITRWRLGMAIFDGDLTLPRGMEFNQLKWYWQEAGVPWWDPSKEVRGHTMAIAAGLDNPQRVCRETGTDFFENVDAIAEAIEYAKSKGVNLQLATTGTSSMDEVQTNEGNE
jgi:capsid protein